jgi:hypothetical protein
VPLEALLAPLRKCPIPATTFFYEQALRVLGVSKRE